jgi:hypothetical protein
LFKGSRSVCRPYTAIPNLRVLEVFLLYHGDGITLGVFCRPFILFFVTFYDTFLLGTVPIDVMDVWQGLQYLPYGLCSALIQLQTLLANLLIHK